jgi:FHS family L-fucose permease-like MFS transporter
MAGGVPIAAPTLASGFLRGKDLIFPLSLVISLFFLWGFSYGLLDVLNKHFQTVLDITKLQSTGLQVVYFGGGYLLFSPIAAEVMKRKGYKVTILMGLSLYSLGAIFFWPTAHFSTYEHRIASFGGKFLAHSNFNEPTLTGTIRLLCLHTRHCLRSCNFGDGRKLIRCCYW